MKIIKQLCIPFFILSVATTVSAADKDFEDLRSDNVSSDWRLSKNDKRHDIKVFIKNEEGKSIRSFRVEAAFDAPIETVARVQGDVENYIKWYFEVLEVKLLRKVSDREYIFYMVHDAPVGMPDRDVVLKATIEPMTSHKPFIVVKMNALPDFIPAKAPYVRMQAENYVIKISPISKERTLLEAEGYIDPGGVAPSWAVNFVQGKGPYTNMMGMRRMVELPQYRNAKTPLPYAFFE